MADVVDIGNDRAQAELDAILSSRPKAGAGASECECGEAISELRMSMGATRCIECQELWERRHG